MILKAMFRLKKSIKRFKIEMEYMIYCYTVSPISSIKVVLLLRDIIVDEEDPDSNDYCTCPGKRMMVVEIKMITITLGKVD